MDRRVAMVPMRFIKNTFAALSHLLLVFGAAGRGLGRDWRQTPEQGSTLRCNGCGSRRGAAAIDLETG